MNKVNLIHSIDKSILELTEVQADEVADDAYLVVCETVGPNSLEFDDLLEKTTERLELLALEELESIHETLSRR